MKLEETSLSMSDQIKELESKLDLKEYYEIKRPTVVFFGQGNKSLRVLRYDILSET